MPYLDSTKIQKAIAKAEGNFGTAELREGSNATAKILFGNAASAFQNLVAMKKSVNQPTEAILQKKATITPGSNKSATHTGAIGDSFVTAITFVPKAATFKVSYKLAENNQFGYQEQLNHRLLEAMQAIRSAVNTYALAQLAALKTQVSAGSGLLTWVGSTAFNYTNDAESKAFQAARIKATARQNKYGGVLDIIGSQQLVADLVHHAAQGTANATNYGYQFGGLNIAEDENLTNQEGGYGFILPSGLVGMTSWNEPINRSGRGDVNANEGLFTTVADPIIPGLTYDLHVKRGLADTVTTGTSPELTFYQDPADEYELAAFYSFSHAMISTTNETPIFAFKQLLPEVDPG